MKRLSLLFCITIFLTSNCGKKDDDDSPSTDPSLTVTQALHCNQLNQIDKTTVMACMKYENVASEYNCSQLGNTETSSCSTSNVVATCKDATAQGLGKYIQYYYTTVDGAQNFCEAAGGTYQNS